MPLGTMDTVVRKSRLSVSLAGSLQVSLQGHSLLIAVEGSVGEDI